MYKARKERTADPSASAGFFTNFANMFGGKGAEAASENAERPDADYMFADVFDEVRECLDNSRRGLEVDTAFSSYDRKSRIGPIGGRISELLAVLA